MEEILASANLGCGRSIHIATLARQTIIDAGAEHLGFTGYFLFEANDNLEGKGINILCKARSVEAAFRLVDIWRDVISLTTAVTPPQASGSPAA